MSPHHERRMTYEGYDNITIHTYILLIYRYRVKNSLRYKINAYLEPNDIRNHTNGISYYNSRAKSLKIQRLI